MVAERLLHSGSFKDYAGNTYDITFYQRVDLNADPGSFYINASMSSYLLLIWSRDGEAYIKSHPDFVSCTQLWVTDLPGTPYHMYYISVFAYTNDTGQVREGNIKIGLQGNNWAEIDVLVHQYAAGEQVYDINADPDSFTFGATEFRSVYMTVWSTDGEAVVTSYPSWMYCNMVGVPSDIEGSPYHSRIYAISARTNTGAARDDVIKIGLQGNELAEMTVPVHQNAAE